ncbi:Potassium channel tetramerization-type BTB domain [Trypanosoma melophagium]|uniref:Potassium channel tetramerization-type BTB domain n=1 Tax=Trypanosoma melophagium TaxID=715481 RepID=UPI00351AA426|nr:Potassium channel tetramerization-type BTB domain [Trypanosoma melophagium]
MKSRAIINAGGQRFETFFSTLQRFPNTAFAKMFPLPPAGRRSREFFLDVTPQVFECVLSFLRTNQMNLPRDNEQLREELVHSLNHWGLLEHAFPASNQTDGSNLHPVELPDICVVQICDHMQHDQGVKRHALTITYGADGFQLRLLTQRIRSDLEKQLSSTYWQCYQTNGRAAFFVTTKVANGTADLLTTSVTQQIIEHTESIGYSLVSSYVTLSPDVVHTSVRMLIHNFTFRRTQQTVLDSVDMLTMGKNNTIETHENITPLRVGPQRHPATGDQSIPLNNIRATDIWT